MIAVEFLVCSTPRTRDGGSITRPLPGSCHGDIFLSEHLQMSAKLKIQFAIVILPGEEPRSDFTRLANLACDPLWSVLCGFTVAQRHHRIEPHGVTARELACRRTADAVTRAANGTECPMDL